MQITSVRIQNFRSIRDLSLDLAETTVLVGPNNAGKTAIIDAICKAMPRGGMRRDSRFDEYDIRLNSEQADPKASRGVSIELVCAESKRDEWPANIRDELDDVAILDTKSGRSSITLRTRFAWSDESGTFEVTREFLDIRGEPHRGRGARQVNLERFGRYLPVFYLHALRDAGDEFSTRSSQFWKRLLKAVEIPPEVEAKVLEKLEGLNREMLRADPKLDKISKTLSGAARIAVRETEGSVDLRMLPMETWDLLSRVDIILQREADLPWLPLQRQGQGIQSLTVLFLFQAFVDNLLTDLYSADSNPVLALEEPETHLHPQACRVLWAEIRALQGQKIITTHSPYLAQYVPFRDLRLTRLTPDGTSVGSLTRSVSERLPRINGLDAVAKKYPQILSYDSEILTVKGPLEKDPYRDLLQCFPRNSKGRELEQLLRKMRNRSGTIVSEAELRSLETWARRIRGEIFFASRWLIVEGPSDYLVVHAMAHGLDFDLDKYGVSVIDAQNNGNPAHFAALAHEFGIPWMAVFDRDPAGLDYKKGIEQRITSPEGIGRRCLIHSEGDLEEELLAGDLREDVINVMEQLTGKRAPARDGDIPKWLRGYKTSYAARLAARLRESKRMAERGPKAFRTAIEEIVRAE